MSEQPEPTTSQSLTSFAAASPARTSQTPRALALKVLEAVFGSKCSASSASSTPDASSSKTSLASPPKGSIAFSQDLPRAGMMRCGSLSALPTLELPTAARGSSWWPTPTQSDESLSRRHGYTFKGHSGTTLTDAVLIHLNVMPDRKRGERTPAPAGPAPAFSEALMGFPPSWTELASEPQETQLCLKWAK